MLLTLPGTPFVYYGEELGLDNGPGGADEEKRTPMPWDASANHGFTAGQPWHSFAPGAVNVAAQASDPGSLLSRYRALIHARHASPAISRGSLQILSGAGPVLAWVATSGPERVLVAHNLGAQAASATLALTTASADPIFVDAGAALDASSSRLSLPAHASALYRLR